MKTKKKYLEVERVIPQASGEKAPDRRTKGPSEDKRVQQAYEKWGGKGHVRKGRKPEREGRALKEPSSTITVSRNRQHSSGVKKKLQEKKTTLAVVNS